MLARLLAGLASTDTLVRSTSACFVAVYVLALVSAVRILDRTSRLVATIALSLVLVVAVFSSVFLLVPAAVALLALSLRTSVGGSPAGDARRGDRDRAPEGHPGEARAQAPAASEGNGNQRGGAA